MDYITLMTLTVADLDAWGADNVHATCDTCGAVWRAAVSFLPPSTTVLKIAAMLECRACGSGWILVEPAWRHGKPLLN